MTATSNSKKICTVCGISKYLTEFFSEKGNKSDGCRGRCKLCDRVARAGYLKSTEELRRAKSREKYKSMDPEEKILYIRKKSEGNKHRLKTSPEALASKKKYDLSDRGIFTRYRNDSSRRGRAYSFLLTFEQFKSLINSPCTYCGVANCRGVDRVNNEEGYVLDNSVPCCRRCNEMKNDDSVNNWVNQMRKIISNMEKTCATQFYR